VIHRKDNTGRVLKNCFLVIHRKDNIVLGFLVNRESFETAKNVNKEMRQSFKCYGSPPSP
jgi:hypothetical protein